MCVRRKAETEVDRREKLEAVFPVGEINGDSDVARTEDDDLLCVPCEDEEEAANPGVLPAVY